MRNPRRPFFVRVCLLAAPLFIASAPSALADIITTSAAVPPAAGVYFVANTCILTVCLQNIQLGNFNTTSAKIVGGNELTVSSVDLTAKAFVNSGGMAGPPIGPVTLSGTVDITYFNKNALLETGKFMSQITSLDVSGSFIGITGPPPHTIEAMLNPAMTSLGETDVTLISSHPDVFQIHSFFDVFAELSIDGGPFVPGPERHGTLGNTPEPAYYVPVFGGIGLIAALRSAKRRRAQQAAL
jgi:hypothetical protein